MAADLSKREGTTVVLLDNPATELHDEGKADILRFLRQMVESGGLQVVYATHERALIDPWRMDRIRVVEKEDEGPGSLLPDLVLDQTCWIESVEVSGRPARYSLFGAPRTIAFEGVSDVYAASALNELLEQKGDGSLHKDSFSINAFEGIGNAPDIYEMLRGLGVDFVIMTFQLGTREPRSSEVASRHRILTGPWSKFRMYLGGSGGYAKTSWTVRCIRSIQNGLYPLACEAADSGRYRASRFIEEEGKQVQGCSP